MANIFFSGEKASKAQAEKTLRQHVAGVCDLRFTVKFEQDDGGSHICLYIEVEDPDAQLEQGVSDALYAPKWEGWRYIILKCPIGYISGVLENRG